MNLYCWSFA